MSYFTKIVKLSLEVNSKYMLRGMICILALLPIILPAQTKDSTKVANKITTKHYIVAKGESLYSIAKKNHCTVKQITQLNPTVTNATLRYGQKLLVPATDSIASVVQSNNTGNPVVKTLTGTSVSADLKGASGSSPTYHVVEQGETLFKIAAHYHQKQDDIRKWNHLTNDNVIVGKKIIVGEPTTIAITQAATESPSTPSPASVPVVLSTAKSTPSGKITSSKPSKTQPMGLMETTQKGIAKWDSGTVSSNGYLFGLCSIVPVGSIVKITNLMNKQNVLVKIIGKLPPNDQSANVMIKIPETAARQLNALDERFVVRMSYFTPTTASLK